MYYVFVGSVLSLFVLSLLLLICCLRVLEVSMVCACCLFVLRVCFLRLFPCAIFVCFTAALKEHVFVMLLFLLCCVC